MHDRGQQSSGGAIAAIAILLVLLLIVGMLAAGGIGFVLLRNRQSAQYEQEMLLQAEMANAMAEENEARAQAALVEAEHEMAAVEIAESPARFTIQLDQAGHIMVDGQQLDGDSLIERLKDALDDGGEVKVVIEAHEDCPFQNVAAITTVCLEVGIRDVTITISEEGSVVE